MAESSAAYPPIMVRGLRHSYEAHPALRGVDLQVRQGTVLGLIGRNGAGKSTLIRALLGLLMPEAGSAWVLGEPALQLTDRVKERLAYVPQQPEVFPWLTAEQMLRFVGQFFPRWDASFAKDTLSRWSIPSTRPLVKLSPGERQRVELIRALASRPEVLVLDEPAAALDPVARRDLLREVALRAGEDGCTVIFSSHIVSDLERVASQVALMHEGQLRLHCELDAAKERYARLWLPAQFTAVAPAAALSRRAQADGSLTLVVERDAGGRWPEVVQMAGARLDALGLEDLFVEIAA